MLQKVLQTAKHNSKDPFRLIQYKAIPNLCRLEIFCSPLSILNYRELFPMHFSSQKFLSTSVLLLVVMALWAFFYKSHKIIVVNIR